MQKLQKKSVNYKPAAQPIPTPVLNKTKVQSSSPTKPPFAKDYENFDSSFQLSSIALDPQNEISQEFQYQQFGLLPNGQQLDFKTQDKKQLSITTQPFGCHVITPSFQDQTNMLQFLPQIGQNQQFTSQPPYVMQPQLDITQLHILAQLIVQKQQQMTENQQTTNNYIQSKGFNESQQAPQQQNHNFQKVFCSESVEQLEIHEISAKNEMPVDHQKNDLKQEVLIKKTDDIYSINGVYSDQALNNQSSRLKNHYHSRSSISQSSSVQSLRQNSSTVSQVKLKNAQTTPSEIENSNEAKSRLQKTVVTSKYSTNLSHRKPLSQIQNIQSTQALLKSRAVSSLASKRQFTSRLQQKASQQKPLMQKLIQTERQTTPNEKQINPSYRSSSSRNSQTNLNVHSPNLLNKICQHVEYTDTNTQIQQVDSQIQNRQNTNSILRKSFQSNQGEIPAELSSKGMDSQSIEEKFKSHSFDQNRSGSQQQFQSEEVEALRSQRDAQEALIKILKCQVELSDDRIQALLKLTQDLQEQLVQKSMVSIGCQTIEIYSVDQSCQMVQISQKDQLGCTVVDQMPKEKTSSINEISYENKIEEVLTEKTKKELTLDQKSFKQFELTFLDKYHDEFEVGKMIDQVQKSDGRVIKRYVNKTEVVFPNGIKREQFDDGYFVIYFENGDVRQTYPDGKVVYFFKEAGVTQTEMLSGEKILLFKTGQLEKHLPNGKKWIYFTDGSKKFVNVQGIEEIVGSDVSSSALF